MRFFSLGGASLGGRSVALTAVAQLYLRTSRPTMGGRGAAFWSWLLRRMQTAASQPRGLAQRRIDPILPAGAVLLEGVEHIAVDAQRHLLLGVGDRRLRCRQLGGLCR